MRFRGDPYPIIGWTVIGAVLVIAFAVIMIGLTAYVRADGRSHSQVQIGPALQDGALVRIAREVSAPSGFEGIRKKLVEARCQGIRHCTLLARRAESASAAARPCTV